MKSKRYIIISPVRNEEEYIEKTLHSIISQTVRPLEWIIVDDGSIDYTEKIVRNYAQKYSWIKLIIKKNRGYSQVGKSVIEAFNEGYREINTNDWGYIVKLNCDLSIEKDFFEKLISRFEEEEELGIAGATSYNISEHGGLHEEKMPEFHPAAAARMYRRECFEDIGQLVETLGWDTIDLLRAHMKGWQTKRYSDLMMTHFRKMSSRRGFWDGKLRTGKNFYITGYHPVFLIARSIYRLKEKPYLIEPLGVICGYALAWRRRRKLVVTPEEKVFLRKQQLSRLIGLKI